MKTPRPTIAPQRSKHWCKPCDYVCKGGGACPLCRQPMTNMGVKWRAGKKGHRAEYVPAAYWGEHLPWVPGGRSAALLAKCTPGAVKWDRQRGRYQVRV